MAADRRLLGTGTSGSPVRAPESRGYGRCGLSQSRLRVPALGAPEHPGDVAEPPAAAATIVAGSVLGEVRRRAEGIDCDEHPPAVLRCAADGQHEPVAGRVRPARNVAELSEIASIVEGAVGGGHPPDCLAEIDELFHCRAGSLTDVHAEIT